MIGADLLKNNRKGVMQLESVNCTYLKTIYYNEQNSYTIAQYQAAESSAELPDGILTKQRVFTALGTLLPRSQYHNITLSGVWTRNPRYPEDQLAVSKFATHIKPTKASIVGYLTSEAVTGVGPNIANRIFDAFGLATMDVIEKQPERLLNIRGIQQATLEKIVDSFRSNAPAQEILSFLADNLSEDEDARNISMKTAMKIRDKFGDKAVAVLSQEPYKLCLIKGFGFLTADKIARKINSPMDSEYRIKEAVRYCLTQNGSAGHLFMEKNELMEAAHKLLNNGFDQEAVSDGRMKEIANLMVQQEQLRHVGGFIYLQRDFLREKQFVEDVTRLFRTFRSRVGAERAIQLIQKAQEKFKLKLAEKQFEAVFGGLTNPIHIITGGPGTGKTTVLCVLVEALQAMGITPEEIVLVAPTGRAAQRMRQSTGFYASTIHSYLRLRDEDSEEGDEETEAAREVKYVVMDESSMTDMELSYRLLKALPDGAAMIFVGDVNQLPSIGPGNVLREMIASEVIPVTKLIIGYRQGKESTIPINADKIQEGQFNLLYKSDFSFIPAKTEEQAKELLVSRYAEYYKAGRADDVQILCPKREKGACCSDNLNRIIQERFNPWDGQSLQIQLGSRMFRVKDKVMQNKNKNSIGISNGDIGVIREIRRSVENEKELEAVIEFDTAAGIRVYSRRDFEHIEHSFATTIHKAQGGEFPIILIPLIYNKMLMKRNLIYTGVTRGKERVEIFGEKRALIIAIKTEDTSKRNTLIARRLVNAFREMTPAQRENPA